MPSSAASEIAPPKGAAGGGSWLPEIVVVALGEPGVPVVSIGLAANKAMSRKDRFQREEEKYDPYCLKIIFRKSKGYPVCAIFACERSRPLLR